MCTRYVLLEKHYRAVLERLGIAPPPYSTRFNIAPGSAIPAVRARTSDHLPEPVGLQWGLIPHWAKSPEQKAVNARVESAADKPFFRDALRHRRCLIPATGFYEWKTIGRTKQPWLFRPTDDQPFAFAGLWDAWRAPDGAEWETCAVLTSAPNALMEPIHHRMPLILKADQFPQWLDPSLNDVSGLAPLLQPWPASAMHATTVSSRMNHVRYDAPDCVTPVAEETTDRPQLSLGF